MLFDNKALKKLIIPLVVEQLLVITVGFADTVMVASVGEAAVSAVSLVDAINILLINIYPCNTLSNQLTNLIIILTNLIVRF